MVEHLATMLDFAERSNHLLQVNLGVLLWTDIKGLSNIFDESCNTDIEFDIRGNIFKFLEQLNQRLSVLCYLSQKFIVDFIFWP